MFTSFAKRLVLRASIITILSCAASPAFASATHGMVVTYGGSQDKYVPCVILSDASSVRTLLSYARKKLGCNGTNIFSEVESTQLANVLAGLDQFMPKNRKGAPMLFVIFSDKGNSTLQLSVEDGLAALRVISAQLPVAREEIDASFIRRFAPPV